MVSRLEESFLIVGANRVGFFEGIVEIYVLPNYINEKNYVHGMLLLVV